MGKLTLLHAAEPHHTVEPAKYLVRSTQQPVAFDPFPSSIELTDGMIELRQENGLDTSTVLVEVPHQIKSGA
jgi:hypothetical protein